MVAWSAGLALIAAALMAALAVELTNDAEEYRPSATVPDADADPQQPAPIRIAVAPVVSPRSSLPRYRALVQELGRMVGRPSETILRGSYAETDAMLRANQCELAFVCTWVYVQGATEYGLHLLAVPVVRGQSTYRSVVIVRRDDAAARLADLRGRRYAGADPLSNTGWFYPVDKLRQYGENADEFFGSVVFTGGHDLSVHAVADGFADCAAVDSLVYEEVLAAKPELGERLRIIHTSPDFGMPPVVAPPGLSPELEERLLEALLQVHESPAGRAALEPLGIDRFVRAKPADYDAVHAMARRQREASQ